MVMRRCFFALAAACLVGVVSVALASAGRLGSVVSPSYLPTGAVPAGANWVSGEGDLSNSRYSPLDQITSKNVQNLKVVWNQQFDDPSITGAGGLGSDGPESQPICCPNGTMYMAYDTGLVAVNPATGAIVWKYASSYNPISSQLHAGTLGPPGANNTSARTESYDPTLNYLYVGQQDGSIVALNAKTGDPVWTIQVSGAGTYGAATGAESVPFTQYYPLPGTNGVVLSAPNGGETPFRGHLDAYDAKTGELLWRTWTLPDPTQIPYILSWDNPAEAATAGAAVWSVPSVDPQLGDVYFGTGNPFPETNRQPGNDLWTETVMALDWKTGALEWYFQATHHDEFDLDLPHPTMVLNVPIGGKTEQVVAEGSKGGYFFVLNARNGGSVPNFGIVDTPTYDPTGKGIALNSLSPSQPVPQGAAGCMDIVDYSPAGLARCGFPANTLATEYGGTNNANVQPDGSLINAVNGLPIVGTTQSSGFTSAAYFAFGGAGGGGNFGYPPSSYDPSTHTYYACLQNESGAHANQGNSPNVSSLNASSSQGIIGFYSAIDLQTNKMLWQDQSTANTTGDCYSGSLSTGGNLAFTGFKGATGSTGVSAGAVFEAFDATTGKILWSWTEPNNTIGAPAVTYMYGGKQYLALYHGVGAPGQPGSTPTGQRDELTVFSL
jgi:alcohol dehydrogenase (cytochrome c)